MLLKTLAAFGLVIALLLLLMGLLKKFNQSSLMNTSKDLSIDEVIPLDAQRRVAVVKYQSKKYVLLLGNRDAVIDVLTTKNKRNA